MNITNFGDPIAVPEGYNALWREYLEVLSGKKELPTWNGSILNNEDVTYLTRRAGVLFPDIGRLKKGTQDEMIFRNFKETETIPLIEDEETRTYRDDHGRTQYSHIKTKIRIAPHIRTILRADSVVRFRVVQYELETIRYGNESVGNFRLPVVLFDLADSYFEMHRPQGVSNHEFSKEGFISTPPEYKVERDIAELYEKLGRYRLGQAAELYFKFRSTVSEVEEIDESCASDLETIVAKKWKKAKGDLLTKLNLTSIS